MENVDPEIKRKRIEAVAKWGLGLAGAVVIAPFVFLAVKGIVGLALALAIGVATIQLAPVFSMKMANWKMKGIVDEAEKNPIETMQNIYIERSQELESAVQVTIEWETELANFDDEIAGFKKDYPEEAPRYQEISRVGHEGLQAAKNEVEQRREDLAVFDKDIKKAKAIYKMALATQKVSGFDKAAEQKVFQDIKQQVAFDSVRTNLNRSFAQMNAVLAKRQIRPALPASSPALPASTGGQVIEMQKITPVKEGIKR